MKNKVLFTNILIYAFFVLTVAVIFVTHRAVPFMMDDLWYETILSEETKLSGIGDVIRAQIWHYNNWGGRSMAHGLLQIILMQGELFADILNTVVTVILAMLIYVTAKEVANSSVTEEIDPLFSREPLAVPVLYITLIMGMLHGLNANWRMSMYWQSGSANYLYITIFILLFVRCYIRELSQTQVRSLKGINIWIVPLAIVTGWSNENMGPTAFLVNIFTIGWLLKKKKPIKIWMILGCFFSLAGSAMCILAPGNFVRSAEAAEERGIIWTLYLRVYSECRGAFEYLFPALLVFLMMWVLYVVCMRRNTDFTCSEQSEKENFEKKENCILNGGTDLQVLVVFAAAVIACGAMILSPHFPDRSTFGSMVLFIVGIVVFAIKFVAGTRSCSETKRSFGLYLIIPGVLIWLHGMFGMLEFLGMSWGWIL